MNVADYHIDEIECRKKEAADVLRAVLHTVLFNRAYGRVKPVTVMPKTIGVGYTKIGDESVEAAVEAAVLRCLGDLEPVGPDLRRGRLCVQLYTRRRRKTMLGLGTEVERVFFERWSMQVLVSEDEEEIRAPQTPGGARELGRKRYARELASAIRGAMINIAVRATASAESLPAFDVRVLTALPFGFESLAGKEAGGGRERGQSGRGFFHRILRAGPPTLSSSTT